MIIFEKNDTIERYYNRYSAAILIQSWEIFYHNRKMNNIEWMSEW